MRGFIGPLGDDFPAIFPIALGLMFFFGAITIAYNAYDYKNTQSNLIRANIMISRSVRAHLLVDSDYWNNEACKLITEIQANYGVSSAMLIERPYYAGEDDLAGSSGLKAARPFFFDGTDKPALCPLEGSRGSFDAWAEANGLPLADPNRRTLALTYPVLVNVEWGGGMYLGCVPDLNANPPKNCEQKTANLVVYTWE